MPILKCHLMHVDCDVILSRLQLTQHLSLNLTCTTYVCFANFVGRLLTG